jgi:Bacterial surface protein, Ig-like domain
MKINISLFFFSLLLLLGISCNKKDDFNYPKDTVGSSKIVYFPLISTNGEKVMAVTQNGTYTDPGATATVNGVAAEFTTDGAVDTGTPGIYTIIYTAKNAEGFSKTDWRMVVVVPTAAANDPVVAANDFSGVYLRGATGVTSTWQKVANGVYKVENPGGSSGVGLYVVVTNYSGTDIEIPDQNAPDFGEVSSTNASYSVGPPASYSWIFNAGGYGAGVRSFVKQ